MREVNVSSLSVNLSPSENEKVLVWCVILNFKLRSIRRCRLSSFYHDTNVTVKQFHASA